jgi:hypothetical protein
VFHVKHSFADTEIPENHVENLLHINPPHQSPQRSRCKAKLLRDNILASPRILGTGSPQRIRTLPQCGAMPFSRDEPQLRALAKKPLRKVGKPIHKVIK